MFIVMLTYKKPIEVVEQYLVAHRAYLDEGYKNNSFIASGPRNPRTGGILLSQLTDRAQLEKILQNDPFALNGIADFEVIEFSPVKYHKEFERFVVS